MVKGVTLFWISFMRMLSLTRLSKFWGWRRDNSQLRNCIRDIMLYRSWRNGQALDLGIWKKTVGKAKLREDHSRLVTEKSSLNWLLKVLRRWKRSDPNSSMRLRNQMTCKIISSPEELLLNLILEILSRLKNIGILSWRWQSLNTAAETSSKDKSLEVW